MLQVSGLLNSQMGGPGVFPPVPQGAVSALSRQPLQVAGSSEKDPLQNNRRSVYIFVPPQSPLPHASGIRFTEHIRGVAHAQELRLPPLSPSTF
jgi:hypothetical protein